MNELTSYANRFPKIIREIKTTFAALAAGSRIVPMADNRGVIDDLAARVAFIDGTDASRVNRRGCHC